MDSGSGSKLWPRFQSTELSLNISSVSVDGEKEDGEEQLDLRRTESDSVLKKVCVFV